MVYLGKFCNHYIYWCLYLSANLLAILINKWIFKCISLTENVSITIQTPKGPNNSKSVFWISPFFMPKIWENCISFVISNPTGPEKKFGRPNFSSNHYTDIIMRSMASQISSSSIVCSTACSDADQRKHQSFAPQAFARGIHQWLVDSPHKGLALQKMFHLMMSSCYVHWILGSPISGYRSHLSPSLVWDYTCTPVPLIPFRQLWYHWIS